MLADGHDDLIAWTGRHVEALARLWQARIELAVAGWSETIDRADRRARRPATMPDSFAEDAVRRVERSLRRVDRFVVGSTCIHRALAAQRMLIRRGLATKVVIGLRRGERAIEGHAWIEARLPDRVLRAFTTDEAGYSAVS